MSIPKKKLHELIDLIPEENNEEVVCLLQDYIKKEKQDIKAIITTLSKAILAQIDNFKGIHLYGSRVKGDSKPNSDIDLIILFDNELTYDQESSLAGIVAEIEYKNDVFIDYHPYTYEALQKNPVFYDEVVNKGIYFNAT